MDFWNFLFDIISLVTQSVFIVYQEYCDSNHATTHIKMSEKQIRNRASYKFFYLKIVLGEVQKCQKMDLKSVKMSEKFSDIFAIFE